MNIIGIIPARFDSTRFPGKPLVNIFGKTMIQRVYEQAIKSKKLTKVVVATDDIRIFENIKSIDGNVEMTSNSHKSGTDRCNEVVQKLKNDGECFDIAINIQGDEPFIDPSQIDLLISCFDDNSTQINQMADWCRKMNVSATPTFFVNGYALPALYNIEDLRYLFST